MKILVVLVIVFGILAYLIYLSRKNQKLEDKVKTEEEAKNKQIEVVKIYEKQQTKVDEIKNQKETVTGNEKSVEDFISTGNDAIASFNQLQNNKK